MIINKTKAAYGLGHTLFLFGDFDHIQEQFDKYFNHVVYSPFENAESKMEYYFARSSISTSFSVLINEPDYLRVIKLTNKIHEIAGYIPVYYLCDKEISSEQYSQLMENCLCKLLLKSTPAKFIQLEILTDHAYQKKIKYKNILIETLKKSSNSLLINQDQSSGLQRLLKIFNDQIAVDRASIVLKDEDGFILGAGINMPDFMMVDQSLELRSDSISRWVIENNESKIITGVLPKGAMRSKAISSAISVPIHINDECVGAVSFSIYQGGRKFTKSDLYVIETLASLISVYLTNNHLSNEIAKMSHLAALGMTASSTAHDIKNILTLFKGSSFMLSNCQDRLGDDKLEQAVGLSNRAVTRLETLITDLLSLSKKREMLLEEINLQEIIAEAEDLFEYETKNGLLEINSEVPEDMGLIIDKERMVRALSNLVRNSMDSVSGKVCVYIEAEQDDDWTLISISDNGPGVPEEMIMSVFESFSSTKGNHGTGIGLTSVMKFCEDCNGTAYGTNSEKYGGFCVTLKLPRTIST